MSVRAYSYLRFSAADQRLGDSARRQSALAEAYAARHDLLLDSALHYEDSGVSAFRSRNSKVGALRDFLSAVESGLIQPGSYLLVESLDRISRDQILSAQGVFLQIVSAGINLVTLIDERLYSRERINENPFELIFSLVSMMRAHEESSTKSRRQRESWTRRRAAAASRPMTSRCPGWLELDRQTGMFGVIEPRAELVRRIYDAYLSGLGPLAIARQLNAERCPTLSTQRRARCWRGDLIHRLLCSSTVVGTLTPSTTVEHDGGVRKVRLPALTGYYPAIVPTGVFERVQREMQARRIASLRSDRSVWNVVARLARCPTCGCLMYLKTTSSEGRRVRYLTCERRVTAAGCPMVFVRYDAVENVIVNRVDDLRLARDVYVGPATAERAHTKRLLDAIFRYETDPRLQVGPRLREALAHFESLAADPPYGSPQINLALRRVLAAITIDPEENRLIVRWADGVVGSVHNVWPQPAPSNHHRALPIRSKRPPHLSGERMHEVYGLLHGRRDPRFPLLTLDQADEALRRYSEGESVAEIAAAFGVSKSAVRRRLPTRAGRAPEVARARPSAEETQLRK